MLFDRSRCNIEYIYVGAKAFLLTSPPNLENLNVVAQANAKEKASIIIMTTGEVLSHLNLFYRNWSIVIRDIHAGLPPKLKQDVNQYVAKLAGATLVTSWNCQQQPTHLLTVTQQVSSQFMSRVITKFNLEAAILEKWPKAM